MSNESQAGVTLIEVMIAMIIMGLVLGLGYSIYFLMHNTFETGSDRSHIQKNIRAIDTILRREIRNANKLQTNLPEEEENYQVLRVKSDSTSSYLSHNGNRVSDLGGSNSWIEIRVVRHEDNGESTNRTRFEYTIQVQNGQDYIYASHFLLNNIRYKEEDGEENGNEQNSIYDKLDMELTSGVTLEQDHSALYYLLPLQDVD